MNDTYSFFLINAFNGHDYFCSLSGIIEATHTYIRLHHPTSFISVLTYAPSSRRPYIHTHIPYLHARIHSGGAPRDPTAYSITGR